MKRLVAFAVLAIATAGAPAQPPGRRFAVLVGVGEYDHPNLKKLAYAGRDASELARLLRASEYRVELLGDGQKPTLANIRARLNAVIKECRKGDLLLVGLAGHGLQFDGDTDAYFCPSDAKPFPEEKATLLSIQSLYGDLQRSNAGIKLLLVDACRDDPTSSRGVDADAAPRPPRGVAALFSCAAGQRAFELDRYKHGVFFHHVIEGLKGAARDADGDVTWYSLSGFVRKRVSRDVKAFVGKGARQEPHGIDDFVGDPPVLVSKRSIPLPPAEAQAAPAKRVRAEDCLPDDTRVVIHMNVRQVLASPVLRPIVRELTDGVTLDGQFAILLELFKDTRTLCFAYRTGLDQEATAVQEAAAFLQGNYQLPLFREAFSDADAYEPLSLPGVLAAYREKATGAVFSLLDRDAVAFAFKIELLREMAEKRAGLRPARYAPGLKAVMATVNPEKSVTIGVADRSLWTNAEAEKNMPGVGRVGAFRVSAHFYEAIQLTGAAGLSNPADAALFAGSVRALLNQARARPAANPKSKGDAALTAAFFRSLQIKTAGKTGSGVLLTSSLSREDVRPMIDELLQKVRKDKPFAGKP